MSLRPPSLYSGRSASEAAFDLLGHEILQEKASALGRAGRQVGEKLARLGQLDAGTEAHAAALKEAAEAVYAYFIQRELCGLRRHQEVIRELGIPEEVLVRLGAR